MTTIGFQMGPVPPWPCSWIHPSSLRHYFQEIHEYHYLSWKSLFVSYLYLVLMRQCVQSSYNNSHLLTVRVRTSGSVQSRGGLRPQRDPAVEHVVDLSTSLSTRESNWLLPPDTHQPILPSIRLLLTNLSHTSCRRLTHFVSSFFFFLLYSRECEALKFL